MSEDLTGKVALVTGASRGIGRAIALAMGNAGADVAVNFLDQEPEAKELAAQIARRGRRAMVVHADVSIKADVLKMIEAIEAQLGGIDILVNNAGISQSKPIAEITEEDWDRILNVNLKSMFLVAQAVLPGMRKRKWGRIINLSSVAAQTGGVIGPHYAASKAGALGLTHSLASLLAKEGITVNAIAPALIATAMIIGNPNARPEMIPSAASAQLRRSPTLR
jgi:3-oxoacyl-[acyl-carrier protein] reductase